MLFKRKSRSKPSVFSIFIGFSFYRRSLNSRRTIVRLRSRTTISALNQASPERCFALRIQQLMIFLTFCFDIAELLMTQLPFSYTCYYNSNNCKAVRRGSALPSGCGRECHEGRGLKTQIHRCCRQTTRAFP